ncbi:uncharacterized protein LOC111641163 [Centruroides sculpturatus]|uniref:uncharacterized protein LOC111641163 n=1 Tax=Centruroides sculpturatus TaxID=218467 RepID=UPI000C6D3291|nr:uncharacterized protein LOC111641163 [Centruroides sculpturatus]
MHNHLQSNHLGQRYTFDSARITSGITARSHFLKPPVRPPAMLLSPHLMTQNGVSANAFSLMETNKNHTGLGPVNSVYPSSSQGKNNIRKKSSYETVLTNKKLSIESVKSSQDSRSLTSPSLSSNKSVEMTLNMLNATEPEVDVESLGGTSKLDYDSSSEAS